MAIPVYLWLKDDGGADIKGSVDVQAASKLQRRQHHSLGFVECASDSVIRTDAAGEAHRAALMLSS